jgi:hypothetical protein
MEKSLQMMQVLYGESTPDLESSSSDASSRSEWEAELSGLQEVKHQLDARAKPAPRLNTLANIMHAAQNASLEAEQQHKVIEALYGEAPLTPDLMAQTSFQTLQATKNLLETRPALQPRATSIQNILAAAQQATPKLAEAPKEGAKAKMTALYMMHRPAFRWAMVACFALVAIVGVLRFQTNLITRSSEGTSMAGDVIEIYAPSKRIFAWNDRDALTPIYQQVEELNERLQPNEWGDVKLPENMIEVPSTLNINERQEVSTANK